ncbi:MULTISPECIES: hypothetical protein [Priestia]|uniref:hypothetical protein n=1 Tax=Priestia TaxID=2800373 RepID=UPI001C8DE65D|nr:MULTISPECIES: hypothetical protein [Priestia]MBY0063341.1 hypothetical protein [Priestia aryabhattai]MDN3361348.1 hypothetical protein [Priestia megaterium]WKU22632.1 hypothetical protein Q3A90_23080 [Priestia megaterium]
MILSQELNSLGFFCDGEHKSHVFSCFKLLIGGQGEDSCGESGTDETPQERNRRGGSPPGRGKRSLTRKSTAV